jgi:acyl-CoA synthetase (AMP-forming)/AMP-acid ligase II
MNLDKNKGHIVDPPVSIDSMGATGYLLENGVQNEKVFLVHGKDQYTFAQIKSAVLKVADYLAGNGLKKGDRVVILDDSSFFWVSAYLGTLLAGGVSVPLPTNVQIDKADAILASCLPSAAFIARRYVEKLQPVMAGISTISDGNAGGTADFKEIIEKPDFQSSRFPEIDKSIDLAALMYTSGSTGEPRGVMVTHGNIIANTQSILQYMSLKPEDRVMAVLPFYYCFGTSLLHTHLKAGASVVVENSFLFPEKVLNRIEETECTGLAGVPSTYQLLLRNTTFKKRDLASVRYFQQAGGKLPVNFIEELLEVFPKKELFVMYGQTEATARLPRRKPGQTG